MSGYDWPNNKKIGGGSLGRDLVTPLSHPENPENPENPKAVIQLAVPMPPIPAIAPLRSVKSSAPVNP